LDKLFAQAGLTVLEPAKAKILSAVFDYALEHGFVYRSLREIAKGTGISHRMLLYHFGSQEKLWDAVLHYVRQVEINQSREQRAGCRDAAELKDMLSKRWARYSSAEYLGFFRLFFEVYGYALSQPDRFGSFLDSVLGPWLEATADLFRQVGFAPPAAASRARILIAGFRGMFLDLLTTGDRPQIDAAADELLTLLCRR
jgi:AcrR family transcriptional regulator